MTLLRVLSLLLAGCGILVLSGAWRRDSKNDRLGKQPSRLSVLCLVCALLGHLLLSKESKRRLSGMFMGNSGSKTSQPLLLVIADPFQTKV